MKEIKPLTKKQILEIPTLLKTMSAVKIGNLYNRRPRTIYGWISRLRSEGHVVITKRGPRRINLTK